MPKITLHNMLIIWMIQHSSIQYTPMKWIHHYLQWTPPHHVIIISMLICQVQTVLMKINPTPHHQEESIPKVNIHTKMFLAMLTSNIMILIMVMYSLSDKYTVLLQQELQNPYWCLHDPITTKRSHIISPTISMARLCFQTAIYTANFNTFDSYKQH